MGESRVTFRTYFLISPVFVLLITVNAQGYRYMGCYSGSLGQESVLNATLSNSEIGDLKSFQATFSQDTCVSLCAATDAIYAGIGYYAQAYTYKRTYYRRNGDGSITSDVRDDTVTYRYLECQCGDDIPSVSVTSLDNHPCPHACEDSSDTWCVTVSSSNAYLPWVTVYKVPVGDQETTSDSRGDSVGSGNQRPTGSSITHNPLPVPGEQVSAGSFSPVHIAIIAAVGFFVVVIIPAIIITVCVLRSRKRKAENQHTPAISMVDQSHHGPGQISRDNVLYPSAGGEIKDNVRNNSVSEDYIPPDPTI